MNISVKAVTGTSVLNEPNGSYINFSSVSLLELDRMYVYMCGCVYICNIPYTFYLNLLYVYMRKLQVFMYFCAITTTATRITFLQLFFPPFCFKFLNSHLNFQINFRKTSKIIILKITLNQILAGNNDSVLAYMRHLKEVYKFVKGFFEHQTNFLLLFLFFFF